MLTNNVSSQRISDKGSLLYLEHGFLAKLYQLTLSTTPSEALFLEALFALDYEVIVVRPDESLWLFIGLKIRLTVLRVMRIMYWSIELTNGPSTVLPS